MPQLTWVSAGANIPTCMLDDYKSMPEYSEIRAGKFYVSSLLQHQSLFLAGIGNKRQHGENRF